MGVELAAFYCIEGCGDFTLFFLFYLSTIFNHSLTLSILNNFFIPGYYF